MRDYIYSLLTDKRGGVIAGFLKFILLVLSYVYIFILALVKTGYKLGVLKSVKLDCKVISVGNITLGGTGKTPFVKMLAKRLIKDGHKVVILIRGYKRKMRNAESGKRNIETMGDEGCLLVRDIGVPVLVGRDRIKTGKAAIEKYHPDIIILDDGFQHWRLKRDLDIVLVNANNPFGNNSVIPRGLLREPLSALKRADIFVLTKIDLAKDILGLRDRLNRVNPSAFIVETVHKPVCLYDAKGASFDVLEIKDKEVCIFSGVADPKSFENTVSGLGAKIKLKFEFSDHYSYEQKDLDNIAQQCKVSRVSYIVTTEKDAVKLSALKIDTPIKNLTLKIEIEIRANEKELYSRLYRV